jgi:hypothetical protein
LIFFSFFFSPDPVRNFFFIMPKYGTFFFAEQFFGPDLLLDPLRPYNFARYTAGLTVRKTIAKQTTYRWAYGRQMRCKYYVPTNPRTPEQQANRSHFADAVAFAKSIDPEDRWAWHVLDPSIGSCPWFLNAVSWYMTHM